jgi:hypothetical protein
VIGMHTVLDLHRFSGVRFLRGQSGTDAHARPCCCILHAAA